jgi:hypothetical protein
MVLFFKIFQKTVKKLFSASTTKLFNFSSVFLEILLWFHFSTLLRNINYTQNFFHNPRLPNPEHSRNLIFKFFYARKSLIL